MELILSDSFEDVKYELNNQLEKMMEFVVPVQNSEKEIAFIAKSIRNAGKLLLMHGIPGVGKSTFIQSLKWRSHMPIREVINLDAAELSMQKSKLSQVIEEIKDIVDNHNISVNSNGVFTIVIDYLESIQNETAESKKAFFRDLNGLLRKHPIFIIWPITEKQDVDDIINYSKAVSGTLFYRDKEVLTFTGPEKNEFPSVLKNTISVLNTGYTYSDFQLTESDFIEVLEELINKGDSFTLRDYIIQIRQLWFKKTDGIAKIIESIPKPTEIWFIFSMPEAEQVVAQFVRKSQNIEECWDAYHAKLDEYIHDNQKAEYWNSNRLQLALSGAFKTKIMYLQTNALVSSLAAYGNQYSVDGKINWDEVSIPKTWKQKSKAKSFLEATPIVKQLNGQRTTLGASRGKSNSAIEVARTAYDEINKVASGYNLNRDGSDKPFNKTLAAAFSDLLPNLKVESERRHPWLNNIYPDITIELEDRLVCLEFHYTKKKVPSAIADYVLKKLDVYMRQIESRYPKLF
ncbi:ATP-binding protein [Lacrimispora sp. AGF001]|uniref:ATP-binding protein n=1 Tax=Lacrimispora sp. AGF001 TaxID=3401631 RepID=UPI003B427A72